MLNPYKTRLSKILFSTAVIISIFMSNIGFTESTVRDIDKSSDYAKEAIISLFSKKIISGDENGDFHPSQSVTRAQMITMIAKMLELDTNDIPDTPTFKDVPKDHWAYTYVEAAYREGIISGMSNDLFGANEKCTREQMAKMFVNALGISDKRINERFSYINTNNMRDKDKISDWAKASVEFSLSTGLMNGTSKFDFDPKGSAKKEQIAVVTDRFIESKEKILNSYYAKDMTIKEISAFEESVVLIETFDKDNDPIAQGSGFYIANGLFLTNYHVLQGASKYTITTSSGDIYEVEGIVKYNEDTDLAIIKTKELVNMKPLKIGLKDMIEKGDRVVAIGSPDGAKNTISNGIISGIRDFEYGYDEKIQMIQTTAPISPGSSGGALFNMKGYVIGVTSSTSEDGKLNFAIIMDYTNEWINELKAKSFEEIKVLDMSKQINDYNNISEEEIKNVIYKAFKALEEENINDYISTIHKFNPAYKIAKEMYSPLFEAYDFKYIISEINVVEAYNDSAVVEIGYTIKQVNGQEIPDIDVFGSYELLKYDGQWKIYYGDETPADEIGEDIQNDVEDIKGITLDLQVKDSVIHPNKPIIYITDKDNSKVYSVNYNTGDILEKSFNLAPESIYFENNEVYISLLSRNHSSYWWEEDQYGTIAILDPDTLKINDQFNTSIDPFDIAVSKDGYIYVSSGSGQWTYMKSYSRKTKQEVSTTDIRQQSYIMLNPKIDKIYTIDTDTSPRDMSAYNISNGSFTSGEMDSPYHGDYEMKTNFKISPDGKYIFNGAGTVFACAQGQLASMNYYGKLNDKFTDIAFDLKNNRFFTSVDGNLIYEYDYSNFKNTNTYQTKGNAAYLYYKDNQLIAISKENNKYLAEVISLKK